MCVYVYIYIYIYIYAYIQCIAVVYETYASMCASAYDTSGAGQHGSDKRIKLCV